MAGGAPHLRDVLEFLRANGFSRAAAALRDDVHTSGGGGSWGVDLDLGLEVESCLSLLPPVKIFPVGHRDGGAGDGMSGYGSSSSSSSSSDDFVSMGSSPSGLTNPYGLWPASPAESHSSSDQLSQFGTARDYDDPNLFGDMHWYDEKFEGYLNDPHFMTKDSDGSTSEDKFVMSIEAEERFGKPSDVSLGSRCKECTGMYRCSVPHCECCSGPKECYGEESAEQERLGSTKQSGFQLKLVRENAGALCWEGNLLGDSRRDSNQSGDAENSGSGILEKELHMLSSFTFTNSDPPCDQKSSRSSSYHAKEISPNKLDGMGLQKEFELHHIHKKEFQPNGNDADETNEFGKMVREFQDNKLVEDGGEDHGTNDELQMYDRNEEEYEVFYLRIIHRKNRTGFEENKDFPIVLNSVVAGRYYVTEYLGSAAFSKVIQAHDLQMGMDVCLKIIKNDKDFFDQSLDEIKLLKIVNKHDPADEHHILRLYDYFYHQEHLFIVCELLRANLYEFQKFNRESGGEVYFTLPRLQTIAQQCLEALGYLHHLGIIHCDLKPENILIKSYSRCEIKIIDLGSSCFRTDNLCLYVQSRSYRAPEVILGLSYDQKIDIWSLGCILAELWTGDVLFPNDSLVVLLARMIGMLGPIDMDMLGMGQETHKYFTDDYDLYHRNEETDRVEYIIPEKTSLAHHLQGSDTAFIEFVKDLLQINPQRRLTAKEALQHPWLSYQYK